MCVCVCAWCVYWGVGTLLRVLPTLWDGLDWGKGAGRPC